MLGAVEFYESRVAGLGAEFRQSTFKSLILDAYGRQCAVTRERALPALDAAHIRDYSERPEHDVRGRTPPALRCPPPVRRRLCHSHPAV